jgi:nucleoside phosphorylase
MEWEDDAVGLNLSTQKINDEVPKSCGYLRWKATNHLHAGNSQENRDDRQLSGLKILMHESIQRTTHRPALSSNSSASLSFPDYTVGLICALPIERAAAEGMLDEIHKSPPHQRLSHDDNHYTFGQIGPQNVVVACLPKGMTGTISAAKVANQMLSSFENMKLRLLLGVGGGVPGKGADIRLGDVVVSKPTATYGGVIQYDMGRMVGEGRLELTGMLNRPPDVLLSAVSGLQAKHIREGPKLSNHLRVMIDRYPSLARQYSCPGIDHDSFYDAGYEHEAGNLDCEACDPAKLVVRELRSSEEPDIHYGLIATGNQVMKNGATRDRLGNELGVLCFEMEAAGLMDNFPCLVIRGICDYADSHKNKRWQGYAAATAAAYAKELLLSIMPGYHSDTREVFETNEGSGEPNFLLSPMRVVLRECTGASMHKRLEDDRIGCIMRATF